LNVEKEEMKIFYVVVVIACKEEDGYGIFVGFTVTWRCVGQ